jgi:serine protease Do
MSFIAHRLVGLRGVLLVAALTVSAAAPGAAQVRGTDAISDLVDNVIDTVVLVSTAQNIGDDDDKTPAPELSPDRPLDDFFRDFFDRQHGGHTRPTGEGSGFVIDPSGVVVTNYHVIEGADTVEVTFNDGRKLSASVIGRDKDVDIALLRVKSPTPLKAVRFGDSDKLRVGQWVVALGNPFGIGLSATSGIISGRNRDIRTGRYDNFIQTDAAINKGNSGGPLFNLDGDVIGINTAILSPTGGSVGIGFAVPAATVKPVIDQIIRYGEMRRGYIGVRIQDVPPELIERLSLGADHGALIAGVVEGGPAQKAGLKVGDVVLSFDGHPVPTSRALQRIVADAGPDRDVEIGINREGKALSLHVRLARLQEDDKKESSDRLPGSDKDSQAPKEPAPKAAGHVLGLDLAPLTGDLRKRFKIDDTITAGVVILGVSPDSPLKDANLKTGDVIVEVASRRVRVPDDLSARLAALKGEGQASAPLLVSSADGKMRSLRVPVE